MADMEADRVVVELLAKVDGFDGKVVQSATQFDASMKKIEVSAKGAEAAVARSSDARIAAIRKESAQISATAKIMGTQLNDVGHLLSGPTSPFVVPVKQAPAVNKALLGISTAAGALGGVVGTVLVSAVVAYAASLADMILKSKDAGEEIADLIEKLQEQERKARLADAANAAFGMTLEGVTKALDDNEKALESLNDEHETAAFKALKAANLQALILQGIKDRTEATLKEAEAQLELNRAQVSFADKPGLRTALSQEADAAAERIKKLRAQLGGIDEAAARAAEQHSKALTALAVEIGSRSELDKIKVRYDRLVDATAERLRTEGKTTAEIIKQTAALREQQRAAEAAARKKPGTADPTLPKVTQAEVKSLIKEVFGTGTAITSTNRTAAQNAAAKGAANSFHLSGQAIDFVPQGGMKAFDKEMLRLAAEARGIKVLELLGPGDKGHNDHGHFAFARQRQGPDQIAAARDRQAKAAAAAALAEERRTQAYENEVANLDGQLIDVKQDLLASGLSLAEIYARELENAKGLVEKGNIDLFNRPQAQNADGSISTVRSMSFGTDKGEVLVPTVGDDGRNLSDQQAIDNYFKTGKHLGIFESAEAATRFAEKLHQQQEVLYDARQPLISAAEQLARLELQAIEISRKKYADNLASLEKQGKLQADEAAELSKLNEERAKLRAELVARREAERKFRIAEANSRQALEAGSARREGQEQLLQGQLALAQTQKERRELETRLLELQYQEERARNDYLIRYAERLALQDGIRDSELREAEAAAELARIRNETLAQRQAQGQEGVNQGTQGPLESFFGNIPGTADEINEALESIAAGGLATFTDALTDAIVNWRGFGDVALQTLRSVAAGIIRLGIQQLLLHTIGKTLGLAATTAASTQMASVAAAAAPAAAAVSLATLGANAGPAAAALTSTHLLSAALAAGGGKGFAAGGYTGNGPIDRAAGIVHGQEYVFDAAATRRIGVQNLEAMRNSSVRPSNARAAAPGGGGGANLSPEAVNQLRSIVGDAMQAMPDVVVHPVIDPADMLDRALATPRGRRAVGAFLADNRGMVGGTLQQ